MIKHLFKIIWNRKKENAVLISEMFISFLVIFGVFSLLVYYLFNYRKPAGFNHENVWVVSYMSPQLPSGADSVNEFYRNLKNRVRSFREVEDVSLSGPNFPFAFSTSNRDVVFNGNSVLTEFYFAEENYAKLLDVEMKSGRWFTKSDEAARYKPTVINEKLQEKLFGRGINPVGQTINIGEEKFTVVGVSSDLKLDGSYKEAKYGMFTNIDSSEKRWTGTMFVKVHPGADAVFEGKLFSVLSDVIGTSVEIEHLDKKLANKNRLMQVPLIIAGVVAGFLVFNVALGLFGVLWYNINKRRSEIGLRRAVGAPARSIFVQLVGEVLVLATLSLVIGLFFAVQFPLLNIFDLHPAVYITAIILSAIFIYILVAFCALYPGRQAAAIYPATALHEE